MCHSDCPPPSTVAVMHESGYWWESDPIELCAFPCELHLCVPQFCCRQVNKCYFPLGSSCQEGGSLESGEDCSEKDYCESKYIFVSSSEGESRGRLGE